MGRREREGRSRREPTELNFGYNLSRGHVPRVGAAAPLPKSVRNVVLVVLATGLLVALAAVTGYEGPGIELLRTALAAGRGIAMLGGSLAVVLVLLYYYSAGIDWPRETAFRLLAIGATVGILLWLAVMVTGWRTVTSWIILLGLLLAGVLGYLGQRDA